MHGIIDNPELIKIFGETLSLVIADSAERGAGKLLGRVKGDAQRRLIARALTDAVAAGFADAKQSWIDATESWVSDVVDIWRPAFGDPYFVGTLIDSLATPQVDESADINAAIMAVLEAHGYDPSQLGSVISVEQFLHTLRRVFWGQLQRISREAPEIRALVQLLLAQRAEARYASADLESSPREYLQDIAALLGRIVDNARDVPAFLPGAKGLEVSRRVLVREGLRKSGRQEQDEEDDGEDEAGGGRAYLLPVDYAGYRQGPAGVPHPWRELADQLRQVVVLSDPGMGKSWLVRTESLRRAALALSYLEGATAAGEVVIPVPVRCDQLARADGETLGQAAASHLTRLGWVPLRSGQLLARQIDSGQAWLMLDAYDELPGVRARERFGELLRSWAIGTGDRRWLLTSRIAGYAGPPVAGVPEVELQALTPDDVIGFIRAYCLPQGADARLRKAVADPAIGGMARIPLLLAMLCSLAAQIPVEQELPRTRTALYERLLRWYLAHPHRNPGSSPADVRVETVLEILSKVAYDFAVGDGGWRDLMSESLLVRAVRASGRALDDLGTGAEQFIADFSVASGLLVPEGDTSAGRSPRYLFLHRTFAEYLTARHLAVADKAERLEVVARHLWFDREWTQVIPMLGGHLESRSDALELFRFLASRPDDAYQQSLLAAVGVLSERHDRETLLPSAEAREFADQVMSVLSIEVFRAHAMPVLAAAGNLTTALTRRLQDALRADDEEMRVAVLQILRGRAIEGLAEQALEFLDADSSAVREQAVSVLAWHQERWIFQALTRRLDDESMRVRDAVTSALARYPVPDLLDALHSASAERCGTTRAHLLQAIAAAADPPPLPIFAMALGDEDEAVRLSAVQALCGCADPSVTTILLHHLGDTSENVRGKILDALASRRCEDPAFTGAYIADLVDNLSRGWQSHTLVVSPMPPRLMAELIARLSSADEGVRTRAAEALAAACPEGCEPELRQLLGSADPAVRLAAAVASGGRREPELLGRLAECLRDQSSRVRRAALKALTASDAPRLADDLGLLLGDDDADVRLAAAQASEGRHSPGLTEALAKCALQDGNMLVVVAAVRALHRREGRSVDNALHSTLNRSELALGTFLFESAARELNARDPDAVLQVLRPYLAGNNPYTQRAAAAALTSCTAIGTVDALIDVLCNGTRKGRISAWWALARRPQASDLITIASHLQALTGETQQRLLTAARELAARRYLQLPGDDRALVRAAMANSSPDIIPTALAH